MKISYNWLKEFLRVDLEAEKVGEILTDLGLEVEGIETFESADRTVVGAGTQKTIDEVKLLMSKFKTEFFE